MKLEEQVTSEIYNLLKQGVIRRSKMFGCPQIERNHDK